MKAIAFVIAFFFLKVNFFNLYLLCCKYTGNTCSVSVMLLSSFSVSNMYMWSTRLKMVLYSDFEVRQSKAAPTSFFFCCSGYI